MKLALLGLGLILCVSLLDVGYGLSLAWAYDLPAAETALQKKDYEKVVLLLSPEVEKLDRKGLFLLAKAYSALKKPEAAIKAYTACLALNPKDFEAKTLIGGEQFAAGKEREALPTLKEALEMNNRFLPAYKLLIDVYEKRKNKYELRILYQDLVEKFGEKSEYITKLCELTTLDILFDLSLRYCQLGIQKDPKEPKNYIYLGLTLKDTGDRLKADSNLKKAADDFPKSDLAQLTYAQYLDEQKNYIGSFNYYKRASLAEPKSIVAFKGLGSSAVEIQKYGEALEAFQKACSLDKSSLPALRKATNSIRLMKVTEWLKKYEVAVERCGD
jgi:tetratricopeptide (TPR) repeat protein